jgi:hypothetical protein
MPKVSTRSLCLLRQTEISICIRHNPQKIENFTSVQRHTSPLENRAEIRNNMAPNRLSNRGTLAQRMLNASFLDITVLILKTFCRSIADSTERLSKTASIFCKKRFHKSIKPLATIQTYHKLISVDEPHSYLLHD